jgi:hypothetical protein
MAAIDDAVASLELKYDHARGVGHEPVEGDDEEQQREAQLQAEEQQREAQLQHRAQQQEKEQQRESQRLPNAVRGARP